MSISASGVKPKVTDPFERHPARSGVLGIDLTSMSSPAQGSSWQCRIRTSNSEDPARLMIW